MAWSTYPIANRPAALRERLGPALARCQTLKFALQADADELAIDWSPVLHPSAELAAALVGATVDPAMTSRIYADKTFVELLDTISRLDMRQKAVIAALAGRDIPDLDAHDHATAMAASAKLRAAFNRDVRTLIEGPALAGWFQITEPDDGDVEAVRPAGYRTDAERDDLLLFKRGPALKALPPPERAALIAVTTAYDDDIARDRFQGRGLKVSAGEGATALWQIDDQALRNSVFGLLASYSGW